MPHSIKVDLKDGRVGVYVAYFKDGKLSTASDEVNYTLETIKDINLEMMEYALKNSISLNK